jgi:exodeoxyribonuclease VII small subunit
MTTKKSSEKKDSSHSFESCIKRLEKIVDLLESGEVPLEESIKMYEEGIGLSKVCLEKLSDAELKIKKISKDVNGKLKILNEDDAD